MKKSRIMALLLVVAMIMSVVPAYASDSVGGYFVDENGLVYEKSGANLVENPGFEDGLTGLTQNDEYYEVSSDEAHGGSNSLKAIKSTKGDGAITAYFAVEDASASYYLSFWYKNTDETAARRPRVTFAFTDSSKAIPTEEDDFTEATNAWISAGTATNDQDMAYSKGEWVQYSTVLKGNGNADACAYVALNIFGLTKDVAYVDDFELYELIPSDEYSDLLSDAVEDWADVKVPEGPFAGNGEITLPQDTGVDGVLVEWKSSSDSINTEDGTYSSGSEEELVILTARLYVEGHYDDIFFEYEYPYIVESMFDPYIQWLNVNFFDKLGSSLRGDVTFPESATVTNYYPATFTWSCSDEAVLDENGKFTAPETTGDVDIIATIECNGNTTKTTKTVKAIGLNPLIPEGLVMYYDFEEKLENGVLKDSYSGGNVYDAEATGVIVEDGYAKFEGGKSAIILPSNYASELGDSYTVSMWVNVDKSLASSSLLYRFFDFGGGTGNSHFIRYTPNSGELAFMDRGTAANKEDFAIKQYDTSFIGKWKYVTVTFDKPNAKATIYVDGVVLGTNPSSYNKLTKSVLDEVNAAGRAIGYFGRTQWNDGANPDYVGLMDDIRVYNRVISQEEITTLYNETRPTVTAPVTIQYVDVDGNKIKDDVVISVEVDTTYRVDDSLKTAPVSSEGQARQTYKFVPSESDYVIRVSSTGENVCTLVFKLVKAVQSENLIPNPSFEDGTTGWTTNNYASQIVNGGNGISIVNNATDGDSALQLTSAQGSASVGALSTKWDVKPNTEYTFSFDIMHDKGDSTTTGFLEMLNASGVSEGHIAGDNPGRVWSGSGEYLPTVADQWVRVEYVFTTTANTTQLGFKLAWIGAERPALVDNFSLTTWVEESEEGESTGTDVPVVIQYVDTEGNKIKPDVEKTVNTSIGHYSVPTAEKTIETTQSGSMIYMYNYLDEESVDELELSILQDNICTLVYEVIKADKNANIIEDGDFDDENGNFSWGNWQTPRSDSGYNNKYFKDSCEDWFYQVNRDTNEAQLYLTGLKAEDYALGTRWNDGVTGLCSMANFVPVKKGKYVVSYDYKHSGGSVDASYISTSFQRINTNFAAGDMGYNNPVSVSTNWQTNTFVIDAPSDGYIYFHFSWVGSGGANGNNNGTGPYWYFDNFEVLEVITFENKITYSAGYAEIVAEDGTEGYLVQATYDAEGALTSVVISDKLTLNKETATKVEAVKGAKLMLVKDLTSLEPLAPAIIAE